MADLLDGSPDAVLVADPDGVIETANGNVESVLGYAPAELEGEAVETLLREADREAHRANRAAFFEDPEAGPMAPEREVYARRKDGSEVPVEIGLGPVEIDGTTYVVATVTDVSERRARLERLRASEQRYRRLLDRSPAPIVIFDDEGVIRYANEASAALAGVDEPDAVLGTPATEFVHPDDRERTRATVERVLEDREAVEGDEYRLVPPDGEVRHVVSSAVPITFQDEPAGEVILWDVTALKQRERELERQNERLEEFASIVSHDLRNPLMVIESSLELAAETGEPEHFERAERAVERMTRLVEDLLRIARHGQAPEETEPVVLGDVARAAWETVETGAASLEIDTDATVEAEPTRLQSLLENLFRNAVEHGHDGEGPVAVELVDTAAGFAVADDGIGVPGDEREAIFERGYSTSAQGTGYGLAIVEDIAAAHDWSVALRESAEGGARFEIET